MGFFSWLFGPPAPKKKGGAAPAGRAETRDALIEKALRIRADKKRAFDKLDPEARERLVRQAMGKRSDDQA